MYSPRTPDRVGAVAGVREELGSFEPVGLEKFPDPRDRSHDLGICGAGAVAYGTEEGIATSCFVNAYRV